MPYDAAYFKAQRRGIKRITTIHPDKKNPKLYMHVYVVRKAGPHGGHTVKGETHTKKG